ncbi:dTDP-4-amino-4,6-dideoxygalactose transaminase [Paraperlucidibaca baekdonensis]|uniref:dTDP-4-amino-4,6-dideoxygalactose transaminase n=1 Tax=Paraperlucidibaca baekdonensis TaxID=748120 RepID=A0A3E0H9I9_9GAMM|nr:dTDP-4-amino-4,6-dideoxygalactose transaminase [Paraperlucidibaca baekdonensis]REH40378.1 dTDP-4-amino-4,6-dideoxygalactose transaminase [Paraperlucidibaca baekdonensis]
MINPIPFNKPHSNGSEIFYIANAINNNKLSGDGEYTKRCHSIFESKYGFAKCLLTTSCTDALEMAAILLNIGPGDEVIVPSYTFVSTANAFAIRGAKIVFADSSSNNPNICTESIRELVTNKTKIIVVVHYAGVACDMDEIKKIADSNNVYIVEDAAQAVDSYYKGIPLGSIGVFGAFSFHETKNIICGEGGLLSINDVAYFERAEIVREKGTNRSAFFRGDIDKYGWVDIGSSFLPSELNAAYLFAQLESIEDIQAKRKSIWRLYDESISAWAQKLGIVTPEIPEWATNNAHMYYLVCRDMSERDFVISELRKLGIGAVFHYQSLHNSNFFKGKHKGPILSNSERYSDCLLRLPLYYDMTFEQVSFISDSLNDILLRRV